MLNPTFWTKSWNFSLWEFFNIFSSIAIRYLGHIFWYMVCHQWYTITSGAIESGNCLSMDSSLVSNTAIPTTTSIYIPSTFLGGIGFMAEMRNFSVQCLYARVWIANSGLENYRQFSCVAFGCKTLTPPGHLPAYIYPWPCCPGDCGAIR